MKLIGVAVQPLKDMDELTKTLLEVPVLLKVNISTLVKVLFARILLYCYR